MGGEAFGLGPCSPNTCSQTLEGPPELSRVAEQLIPTWVRMMGLTGSLHFKSNRAWPQSCAAIAWRGRWEDPGLLGSITGGALSILGRLISSLEESQLGTSNWGLGVGSPHADFPKSGLALQEDECPAYSALSLMNANYHFLLTWPSPSRRAASAP